MTRHVGEVRYQALPYSDGAEVVRARLRTFAESNQLQTQAIVTYGRLLSVCGHGGKVGGQLRLNEECLAVLICGFCVSAQVSEKHSHVAVRSGKVSAVDGHGGRLG